MRDTLAWITTIGCFLKQFRDSYGTYILFHSPTVAHVTSWDYLLLSVTFLLCYRFPNGTSLLVYGYTVSPLFRFHTAHFCTLVGMHPGERSTFSQTLCYTKEKWVRILFGKRSPPCVCREKGTRFIKWTANNIDTIAQLVIRNHKARTGGATYRIIQPRPIGSQGGIN